MITILWATSSFIPSVVAFIIGITWAKYAVIPVEYCWIIAIVLATRIILLSRQPNRTINNYLILAFFLLIGGAHAEISLAPPHEHDHISQIITKRQEVSIIGTVHRSPETAPDKTYLLINSEKILTAKGFQTIHGFVRLAMPFQLPANISPGKTIIARASLSPVTGYGVPGIFDYKSFLGYQSIWTTGWIKSPLLLDEIKELGTKPIRSQLSYSPEKIRHYISNFLNRLDPKISGIYKAILIGDRSSITTETIEQFKASGTIHLLAISGMHMGLLALCSGLLFNNIMKRSEWILLHLPARKIAAALTLVPLACYAMIAGFHTPVVRSLIMVTVFILALIVDRQWSIPNNIAIAALIILGVNPQVLFTASFQLSFAAVTSISLFTPTLHRLITQNNDNNSQPQKMGQRLKNWILFSIIVSTAAVIGTAPILALHFNRVPILSPFSTLVVEPFLCLWSLMIGLIACLFIPIMPSVAEFLFNAGGLGIQIVSHIVSFIASFSFTSFWLPSPSLYSIAAWYCLLMLWNIRRFIPTYLSCTIALLCIITPVSATFLPYKNDQTQITVLDVGLGSAIVTKLPDNSIFLIDGGKRQAGPASRFNVGERVIAPYLWHNNISKIDGIIISHPDADHYNGLPFILQRFKPDTVWINNSNLQTARFEYRKLIKLAKDLGITVHVAMPNQTLYSKNDVTLQVLGNDHPNIESQMSDNKGHNNNQSLVLRLDHGDKSFIFPGDIEEGKEKELAASANLDADVLIAPHHGSKSSSSVQFLKAVSPDYIVVSAGPNKPGRFPAQRNMVRYKEIGSNVLLTAEHGTIFLSTDGTNLQVNSFYKQ